METEICIKTKTGETFCKRMELEKEYSEETKRKHEKIIRKLLEDFDMEKTKDKYRNGDNVEYRLSSTGLENMKFREELIRLMGSDVIRINDRKWNEEFHRRIEEEYHKSLDQKEKSLADAEEARIRKLKLEGLVPMSDESDCDQPTNRRTPNRRRKHSHKSCKKNRQQSQQRHPIRDTEVHEEEKSAQNIKTQMEVVENGILEENYQQNAYEENERPNVLSGNENESDHHNDIADTEAVHYPTRRFHQHKVPQEMDALYEEESVNGLYSLAARLVSK